MCFIDFYYGLKTLKMTLCEESSLKASVEEEESTT